MAVIWSYGRGLPRLEAQESIRMAERLGVGTGSIKPAAAGEIQRRWHAESGLKRARKRADKQGKKPPLAVHELAAMGIGLRPRKKKGST